MQPLVLAIEPDTRQAAIVKRIVREKVLADVTVVDSRDAALEAMRTMIPDVLLLSALLSPRDEDEIFAHLRTLRDAEHLQTYTIPQLASSLSVEEEKPKGLLSAFRRKKGQEPAPTGCDPDLFADEIRTYLKRASDKKREVRASGPMAPVAHAAAAPAAPRRPEPVAREEPAAAGSSSWESPFEWRPSQARTQTVDAAPPPEPAIPSHESFGEPEPFVPDSMFTMPEPVSAIVAPTPIAEPEPVATRPAISDWRSLIRDPEPAAEVFAAASPAVAEPEPAPAAEVFRPTPRVRYPLTVRKARGWWFVDGKFAAGAAGREDAAGDREPELRDVLASLAVPWMIAAVAYADGCRIRRVRLNAATT